MVLAIRSHPIPFVALTGINRFIKQNDPPGQG
jgi:hypothetical protein